ncbi:MAG: hypothetical protein M1832_002202 [Thelocarpon impressellum]|nr:MAG: hypothetical protein M1832_002202 [Thelocarpon impressellum]
MGQSLESSRPMLSGSTVSSKRASARYSTYSISPSVALSDGSASSTSSADPRAADIRSLTDGLDRLECQRLQQQRYVPSDAKTEALNQLALQAKLERALGRRMTGQDAVLRPKVLSEKRAESARV